MKKSYATCIKQNKQNITTYYFIFLFQNLLCLKKFKSTSKEDTDQFLY